MQRSNVGAALFWLLFSGAFLLIWVGSTTQAETGLFHLNLKEQDMEILAQTRMDGEAASIEVTPLYVDAGATRTGKQWTEVGTWTSSSREIDVYMTFRYVNLWYSLVQEGYDAEGEFRLTIYVDGNPTHRETYAFDDEGDELVRELYEPISEFNTPLGRDESLDLQIEYAGYEDLVFYFDNSSHDTGVIGESDLLRVFGLTAENETVQLEVYDAFGSDWGEVGKFMEFKVAGQPSSTLSMISVSGRERMVNETIVISTFIIWNLEGSLIGGDEVEVWVKYTQAEAEEEKGVRVMVIVVGNSTTSQNDDETRIPNPSLIRSGSFPGVYLFYMAGGITLLGGTVFVWQNERSRWWLYLGFYIPLLSRIRDRELEDPERFKAGQIYQAIQTNPGINLSALKQETKVKNGTLIYHLSRLENDGLIKTVKQGQLRLYYLVGTRNDSELEMDRLRYLRETQKRVVKLLYHYPDSSQRELAEMLGMNVNLISYHLRELLRGGHVKRKGIRGFYTYRLEENTLNHFTRKMHCS